MYVKNFNIYYSKLKTRYFKVSKTVYELENISDNVTLCLIVVTGFYKGHEVDS